MMKRMHPTLLMLALALAAGADCLTADPGVLSDSWRFHLGPAPSAAHETTFDDSGWRTVRLPHDWAIEGPFEPSGDGGTGKLPWKNEGWYRRSFELPAGAADRRVYFDFDGVMAFPRVFINGQLAGAWDYGYTSFRIDATPYVNWGEANVIAVHVDTRRWGSRWYPGAGIYRKVAMTISEPVHIAHWGIQVQAPGPLAGQPAIAEVASRLENHGTGAARVTVRHRLQDPAGQTVAESEASLDVPDGATAIDRQVLPVTEALAWDVNHPHLYTLFTDVEQDGRTRDRRETRFGFRSFEFTADDGFHLNGRRVQLFGVNLHHDLGPLGAAFNRRAARRQLEIMQDMGVNALRTSHNPPAPEVLDLADEMGIIVWNEAFDKYAWTAGRPDLQPPLPEFSRRHIESMIRRDFNHPSVVTWSIGNEVWAEEEKEGVSPERVRMMVDYVHELDPGRPASMACHIPPLVNGRNFEALDLAGWNYGRRYANYREQYPDRPIVYSESASALSTRGYYDPDLPDRPTDYSAAYQISSYDLTAAPYSDVVDAEFRLMEKDRFVAGEFVWTGFDYLGEPTPHAEQARSSYYGAVDLCGFPKDRFYLYRSHWRSEVPTVHILPHWNWPDRIGRNVPVFVYTNGDAAELFLNGRSLGMRRKGEVPDRLPNLALQGTADASSATGDLAAAAAADGRMDSQWQAEPGDTGAWWQIDLGQPQRVAKVSVDTLQKENLYRYTIESSLDGRSWRTLVDHPTRPYPLWSGPTRMLHDVEPADARFLRLTFSHAERKAPFGLKEFMAFSGPADNDYYDVTYRYRLRWNEVNYEPGELRAVAYRDGTAIGEATVETTGAPAILRLQADRTQVLADGEDLVFVTVETLDARGRQHPLADNLVRFEVEGAGEIAAVGNGNPLSFEPFLADRRHLFYGKALLVIRPQAGAGGVITVTATSPGLESAALQIEATAPQPAR